LNYKLIIIGDIVVNIMEFIQYCSDIGGFLGFVVFYLLLKQRATDKRLEEGDNFMKELSKDTKKMCEDVSFIRGYFQAKEERK